MAETVVADLILRRNMRKERVFRDRMNPLEMLRDNAEVKARYRYEIAQFQWNYCSKSYLNHICFDLITLRIYI